ncbi:CxxH/CxxC protein [Peribacillus muralis]|uniref:CxxH/CxxC protein n=1 Tax=Peribacillus muralis TaxID=264697 RepID=UPI0027D460AD|nr:CxxH/CxxC protein [Peribacillus muralis]
MSKSELPRMLWIIDFCRMGRKGEESMELYCCQEHVEMALDEVVYECETYPVLTQVSEEKQLSTTCEYCRNVAIYLVGN